MAYYVIKYEGEHYANAECYIDAIAGGGRTLLKMAAQGLVAGSRIFDVPVYRLSAETEDKCRKIGAASQDFDQAYQALNRLPRGYIERMKAGEVQYTEKSRIITMDPSVLSMLDTFEYRHCLFFRLRDLREPYKYKLLPRMAAIQVCGGWYVAFDTINRLADDPVIVSA
jgi:hypothetical protein